MENVLGKRSTLRPRLGDYIDLCIPQSRLVSLINSNESMSGLLYISAQVSARRNAYNIINKLGMPSDFFWKFEYWPKARARDVLGQILDNIFSSIMIKARAGRIEMTELDVDPLRIVIDFQDCVECAGIQGLKHGMCYYHAGIISGIISALINKDVNGFEMECHASGNESCRFIIGDKENEYIKSGLDDYFSPTRIDVDLMQRLHNCLDNIPVRPNGNLVDINYHRMTTATFLSATPQTSTATNNEVDTRLGYEIAQAINKFYRRRGLRKIRDYYSQVGQSSIEVNIDEHRLELTIAESADASSSLTDTDMMGFLLGKLQGLLSELIEKDMVFLESRVEGENLVLLFTIKEII